MALSPSIFIFNLLIGVTALYFCIVSSFLINQYHLAVVISHATIVLFVSLTYGLTICTEPGTFKKIESKVVHNERLESHKYVTINGRNIKMKWCSICKFYRPPRTIHCSSCNSCIEQFDHHCSWLDNCIGKYNYRYFFCLIFFLSAHLIFTLVATSFYVHSIVNMNVHFAETLLPPILILVISGVVGLPIIILTILHGWLVASGKTTHEQLTGKFDGSNYLVKSRYFFNCYKTFLGPIPPQYLDYNTAYEKETI